MATIDQRVRGHILRKFGETKPASRGEVRVNCPFCSTRGRTPDNEFKLYINVAKNVCHCFRCSYSTRVSSIIPSLAGAGLWQGVENPTENIKQGVLEQMPPVRSLDNLSSDHLAVEYIVDRDFTVEELKDKAFYCHDYKKNDFSFGPRLIFPFYQLGLYRGFQGRTLWKNTNPKYVGASGMEKGKLLFNYDEAFSQNEELIVTEGPFDCLKVGNHAVATLGKGISDDQLSLIRLGDFGRIAFILDKDAVTEAKETAKKVSIYSKVYLGVVEEFEDLGDRKMSRAAIKDFLVNGLERVY